MTLEEKLKLEELKAKQYIDKKEPFNFVERLKYKYSLKEPLSKLNDMALDYFIFYKNNHVIHNKTFYALRDLGYYAVYDYFKRHNSKQNNLNIRNM